MKTDTNLQYEDGTTTTFNTAAATIDLANPIKIPSSGSFANLGLGEPQCIDAMITTGFGAAGSNLFGLKLQLFTAPDVGGSPGSYDTQPLAEAIFRPVNNLTVTVTLSTALVASNSTTAVINGITIGPSVFATDSPTSIAALVALINANTSLQAMGIKATYPGSGLIITLTGPVQLTNDVGAGTIPFVTTAGAGQPTYAYSELISRGMRAIMLLPPMPYGQPWTKLRVRGLGISGSAFASFASYVGKLMAQLLPADEIPWP